MSTPYGNVIAGVRVAAQGGQLFESRNPARPADVVGLFARSGPQDGKAAIAAARAAWPGWAATPAPQRASILEMVVAALEARTDEIARAISREMGKVLAEAAGYDVGSAIKLGKYMVGEGQRMSGVTVPSEMTEKFACTLREPIGVVSVITPWNLPMLTPAGKIFAALICGNTVVFKPSEETAMAGHMMIELLESAGLPPGVVNLLTGYGAEIGDVLLSDPDVDMVSFTGSTQTGRYIGGKAGAAGKKISLEMGGKNAIVIMDDADLDLAVEGAVWGGYGSSGQRCTASSRIIVHQDLHDRFLDLYASRVSALRVGDPLDPSTQLGPVVSLKQLEKIHSYTKSAVSAGARLLVGGHKLDINNGHFYAPTLFSGVTSDMRIAQDEIFGPVVAVLKANDFAHAMALANSTSYGLSLAIYTQSINRAFAAVRGFKSGLAYVNAPTIGSEMHLPFGGTKGTGNGTREYAQSAIEDYTELKTVFVDYSGKMRHSGMDSDARRERGWTSDGLSDAEAATLFRRDRTAVEPHSID